MCSTSTSMPSWWTTMQLFPNQDPQVSNLRSWTMHLISPLHKVTMIPLLSTWTIIAPIPFLNSNQLRSLDGALYVKLCIQRPVHPVHWPLHLWTTDHPHAPHLQDTPKREPCVATWFQKPSGGMPKLVCFSDFHHRTVNWLLFRWPSPRGYDVIPLCHSFAQSRDHGSLKKDVPQFFLEQVWWWQCMLLTQAKVGKCTRFACRMSRGTSGGAKDFYIIGDLHLELGVMCTDEKRHRGAEWDVRTFCAGKGVTKTQEASRNWCGTELWRSSTVRPHLDGPSAEG